MDQREFFFFLNKLLSIMYSIFLKFNEVYSIPIKIIGETILLVPQDYPVSALVPQVSSKCC